MAEGTPLERVQVVNSGARVQIPPSPFCFLKIIYEKRHVFNKWDVVYKPDGIDLWSCCN